MNRNFINDLLGKKAAEHKAFEMKKKEKAEKTDFYKKLANIDSYMTEMYTQTFKHY